jgi:hypothetical protein
MKVKERIINGCSNCPFYRTSYHADHFTDKECHYDEQNIRMTYYGGGNIFIECPLKKNGVKIMLKESN